MEELKAKALKATAGPWVAEPGRTLTRVGQGKAAGPSPLTGIHKVGNIVACVDGGPESGYFEDRLEQAEANAAYIAAASPDRILALLADLEAKTKALEEIADSSDAQINPRQLFEGAQEIARAAPGRVAYWHRTADETVAPSLAKADAILARGAGEAGGGDDENPDAILLLTARYVLRDMERKDPTCGYGKMAAACERAALASPAPRKDPAGEVLHLDAADLEAFSTEQDAERTDIMRLAPAGEEANARTEAWRNAAGNTGAALIEKEALRRC